MSRYFTINKITRGFFIAFLSAGAIYLDWLGLVSYFINTILGVLTLYLLLKSDRKIWFWSGFFIGVLWFWWMSVSFFNYGFAWAIPIGILFPAVVYGFIFWFIAKIAEDILPKLWQPQGIAPTLLLKALALLTLSYLHPFSFDWFKMELIFTNSYLGIQKWQFAIVLFAISLTIYKQKIQKEEQISTFNPTLFLFLIIFAYPFTSHFNKKPLPQHNLAISNTMVTVTDKWNPKLESSHVDMVFEKINRAIKKKKSIIVFPESVLPIFLNTREDLMTSLQGASNDISIVIGGLYWDNNIPRNSTYIFKKGRFSIANKVVLVPFGESNPLPKWMGKIVNELFFDGAPDYVSSSEVTDYEVNGITFRNAICFEGTSEELYVGDPKQMIVISNNGWVTPSIEPTQQKILLQYYNKKYGTTIYHSANMSSSYIVHNGEVIK
ncbi:MAG TPA: apolipoprotein N-acyltransferase [Sulfurovum sp.]|nr:apolipoprotein N-acyltransferase [Sulfurovum sp.]